MEMLNAPDIKPIKTKQNNLNLNNQNMKYVLNFQCGVLF